MQADTAVLEILKRVPLFSALSRPELDFLATRTVMRSYGTGQLLFSEGEPCAGLFIVAKGRVRVFKTSPGGREQVLAIQGPGGSIAELPVFDGGDYPASVAATEPAELLFVSRKDFRALCLAHPEVSLKVLEVVGSRLRKLVGIIEELSFTTVRHRLIAWILREADEANAPEFPLRLSHQEIAARIGTVRELVTRNLNRLQAEGLIEITGREIKMTRREGLESELSSAL